MNELYREYYDEVLCQSKSQRLDQASLDRVCRKYHWNYKRFFRDVPARAAILDLGCGAGQFLYYLGRRGFENLMGVELSAATADLARTTQPNADIRHIEDTAAFLQAHEDRFDVIVLNDVLEHVPVQRLVPMTRDLHAALKPGGLLILKTINAAYPLGYFARYQDLTHTTCFHEKALKQLLRHCGFTDCRCFQEEIGVYHPLFAAKKTAVLLVRFFLKLLIYFSEADWPGIISVNLIASARKP